MNGIEKITARIGQDSQAEINALLAEAKAQAADITAKARAEAQTAGDEVMAQGRKAAAEREDRLASVAQLECRKAARSEERRVGKECRL